MISRHDRYLFGLWLARWGFAAMVAGAIAVSFVVVMTVAPPAELPAVTLRTAPVFRVEVGAAVFFGQYLAAMAFALALQNRGFTEFGTGGIRAQDLASVSQGVASQDVSMELIGEMVEEVHEMRAQREEERRVD